MTVSTSGENPSIDLEVIRTLRARGIHTVMGVSNVSFGLPNRDAINSTFLALSMDAGLAAAIMNPQSERMRETYLAFLALKGKDAGCQSYVAAFTGSPKKPAATAVTEYGLKEAVIKGLTDHSRRAAQKLLENHKAPMEIINGEIIPALNEVGEGFGNKTLFLPQLLMSADAAKGAFEVLKEYMQRAGTAREDGEPIVLATVRGDIHDIGKNIVKVLWENYGYRVLDLGRDVAPERILAAVRDSGAKLVGMTALMTTTVPAMEETIQLLRHEHVPVQILVGGAVLTADYASRIGADGYAGDAVAAVEFANALFGKA
jgi:5-methyltetrahydrofolate--homocysteine methyltransferase